MIKINLATRKQAIAVGASEGTKGISFGSGKLDLDFIKAPGFRKMFAAIGAVVVINYSVGVYKAEEVEKVASKLPPVIQEQSKLRAELSKMAQLKEQQKELTDVEQMVSTKIEVIKKLIQGRELPPQILKLLSEVCPPDVWITDLRIENEKMFLKGEAIDLEQITPFVQNIKNSALIASVNMENAETTRDREGGEVASFQLAIVRR